jgi:hypothetical protein
VAVLAAQLFHCERCGVVEWCGGEQSERREHGPAVEWSDMWASQQ